MIAEWSVSDTVNAEVVNEGETIAVKVDGFWCAAEVVATEESGENFVLLTVESDLDCERSEVRLMWDAQVDILYRDYSDVEA